MEQNLVASFNNESATTGRIAIRSLCRSTRRRDIQVVSSAILHNGIISHLVYPVFRVIVDGHYISGSATGIVKTRCRFNGSNVSGNNRNDINFSFLIWEKIDISTVGRKKIAGGIDKVCLSSYRNFNFKPYWFAIVIGHCAGRIDYKAMGITRTFVVAYHDITGVIASATPTGSAGD